LLLKWDKELKQANMCAFGSFHTAILYTYTHYNTYT